MPKQDIRMSPEEIDRFLRAQATAVLVVTAKEGPPAGTTVRLDVHAGHIALTLRDDDPVVELLAADDRACCIVDRFPSYFEITGVLLHGRATRRPATTPHQATLDLALDHVVSFDFSKLSHPG